MTATTLTFDLGDQKPGVGNPPGSIATGGTIGARCLTLIIDWAKVTPDKGTQLEMVQTLERMAQVVREQFGSLPRS
jgi:hypothetical protein